MSDEEMTTPLEWLKTYKPPKLGTDAEPVPTDHVGIAREYLAKAQSIAEVDLGHGLFTMGCALKHTLDALEGHQHAGHADNRTGPALPVEETDV